MSKQEEASLILKLYELRREEVMRKARDWYFAQFHPETADDVWAVTMTEYGAYARMVTTYWDMAAALVNHGAISREMFTDTNGEHIGVFAKIEPFVEDVRQKFGNPRYLANLEKLVDETPGGRDATKRVRAFQKGWREQMRQREGQQASA